MSRPFSTSFFTASSLGAASSNLPRQPLFCQVFFQVTLLLSAALSILAPSSVLCQDTFFAPFSATVLSILSPARGFVKTFFCHLPVAALSILLPLLGVVKAHFFTLFATAFSSLLPLLGFVKDFFTNILYQEINMRTAVTINKNAKILRSISGEIRATECAPR